MIRRDANENGFARWILISQVDHARLSARLAEHWGAAPFARLEPENEIVAAVRHHDDGWAAWERSPQVDPQRGRPLDFTEMPLDDALAIWRSSIAAAAAIGHLAAWMVSGHFSALLRRSDHLQADSPAGAAHKAAEFLAEEDVSRSRHLEAWIAADRRRHNAEAARRALSWLQMFDWLSLWFCCAERTKSLEEEPPGSPPLTIRPVGGGRFQCSPWPFDAEELVVESPGCSVPAAQYADATALAAAPSRQVTLRWILCRSP